MPKFVIVEVWTRWKVIEAANEHEAYKVGEPKISKDQPLDGLNLSNWHAIEVTEAEGVGVAVTTTTVAKTKA